MAKDDFDLEVVDDSKASFGSQVWFVLNALLIVLPPVCMNFKFATISQFYS